jgi:diguanylate cyclase (GGDEF)-like protein
MDYFELEEIRMEERESLKKVISTFGALASVPDDMVKHLADLKGIISSKGDLPIDEIDSVVRRLKDKILENERVDNPDNEEPDMLLVMEEKVIEACRIIKRIMAALLENFYPLSNELKNSAENINIECKGEILDMALKEPASDLLGFIESVRIKISDDFKSVNEIFLSLLEQVKELEKTFSAEFGGQKPQKEIEYFEMKINQEVGSIANSFNAYTTISEVKEVVVEKLKNIKNLVALRKKRELKKAQMARENINKLKKKINSVENDALKMSQKAEAYEEAAVKDGLTGLYNRGAFDAKIKDSINTLNEKGTPFSVVLFDVDKFKSINDNLGHVAGDKVLIKIAECLLESFRKDDFIARYGGDEFIVIIETLTQQSAQDRITIFRKNLKKRKFISYKEGEINLTVSVGISLADKGDTPASLLDRADKAMYEDKQKQRYNS